MWSEFKEFIARGNVLELAIAVIIGAAFSKIVDSLVEDMIMPVIGIIVGGVNFETLHFKVGGAVVLYGKFIQTMVDFLLVSVAIFIVIKIFNAYHNGKNDEETDEENQITDIELLTEIRDLLKQQEQNEKHDKVKKEPHETIVRIKAK
jgi:large conductance mechanosensitive channel